MIVSYYYCILLYLFFSFLVLTGTDLEDYHCWLNYVEGSVTLHPKDKAMCAVNGQMIDKPTKLTQG